MKNLFLTTGLLLLSSFLFSQTANITLRVKGIDDTKGIMAVALFDSEEMYKSKDTYVHAEKVKVTDVEFTYVFKDVSPGIYAIKVYHDVNEDGKLSTNWIGMPKEPFGFSNDAKGRMGPPDYEDASFEVNGDIELIINLMSL